MTTKAAKERPWLAYTHEVRAILDGRQTQFRRVIKPLLKDCAEFQGWVIDSSSKENNGAAQFFEHPLNTYRHCPYGNPGDRLWVRETWTHNRVIPIEHRAPGDYIYRAELNEMGRTKYSAYWKPSIHMPRAASRITLEVKRVWVERVQDISDDDAFAEGVLPNWTKPRSGYDDSNPAPSGAVFADLWDSVNASRGYGWDTNPWVWCVEFERVVDSVEV